MTDNEWIRKGRLFGHRIRAANQPLGYVYLGDNKWMCRLPELNIDHDNYEIR